MARVGSHLRVEVDLDPLADLGPHEPVVVGQGEAVGVEEALATNSYDLLDQPPAHVVLAPGWGDEGLGLDLRREVGEGSQACGQGGGRG